MTVPVKDLTAAGLVLVLGRREQIKTKTRGVQQSSSPGDNSPRPTQGTSGNSFIKRFSLLLNVAKHHSQYSAAGRRARLAMDACGAHAAFMCVCCPLAAKINPSSCFKPHFFSFHLEIKSSSGALNTNSNINNQ